MFKFLGGGSAIAAYKRAALASDLEVASEPESEDQARVTSKSKHWRAIRFAFIVSAIIPSALGAVSYLLHVLGVGWIIPFLLIFAFVFAISYVLYMAAHGEWGVVKDE